MMNYAIRRSGVLDRQERILVGKGIRCFRMVRTNNYRISVLGVSGSSGPKIMI